MTNISVVSWSQYRPASLWSLASVIGLTPLNPEKVREHMVAEQAKAPKPTRYSRFMGVYGDYLYAACIFSGIVIIATTAIATGTEPKADPRIAIGLGAMLVGALLIPILNGRQYIIDEAKWSENKISKPKLRHEDTVEARARNHAREISQRFRKLGVQTMIIEHQLTQDTKGLDPVIEIRRVDDQADSVFVAIYDSATNYCELAMLS